MVTKGIFKFEKNVVLDESTINELHSLLLEYCTVIKYRATTLDSKSLEFETHTELLSYDNFKKSKITELEITGYNEHKRILTLDFYGKRHSSPYIECQYSFTDIDSETLFTAQLKMFFEKRVECYNHHLFTSALVGGALLIGSLYLVLKYKITDSAMFALAFLEVIAYYLIENKILKSLFPPIVFRWGNEIKVYKSRTNIRNNLFWTIIASFGIGVLLEMIFR